MKKRVGLFEDASNPSQPLAKDRVDSPVKEHNQEMQAEWQNVRYYGQNPQEMIYNTPKVPNETRPLMDHIKPYDLNMTRDKQMGYEQGIGQHYGGPVHNYAEPSFNHNFSGAGNQQNLKNQEFNQATVDDQGRPLRAGIQQRGNNAQFSNMDSDGFMTPLSPDGRAFNFDSKQTKVKNMIMMDRGEFEPKPTMGFNSDNRNQSVGTNQASPQRNFSRNGPTRMLNLSLHDSKNYSIPQIPEPPADSFNRNFINPNSHNNSSNPKIIPGPSGGTAKSGLNKFAPLEPISTAPMAKQSGQFGQLNDTKISRDPIQSSPHQFLSRDPVLQSIGRPYY